MVPTFRLREAGEWTTNRETNKHILCGAQVSVVRCPNNARWRGSDSGTVWDKVVREGVSEEVGLEQKLGGGEGVSQGAIWAR